MDLRGDLPAQAAVAWQRAARARASAERAFRIAERYDSMSGGSADFTFKRLAGVHRTTGSRHQVAAELLEAHARRVGRWVGGPLPLFMTGVAEACGSRSVAVTLVDNDHHQVATASSDQSSSDAQELEYVLGEGPVQDAVEARAPVEASGAALSGRWPGYGPALAALGIGQVVAVPLEAPGECIGALAVFDPPREAASTVLFSRIADALTRSVLLDGDAVAALFSGIDYRAVVHQAAGVVAVQLDCSVDDALEMVKARAFADGRAIGDVAADIVNRQLKLG
ncbi:GAF and ANTAR domain-containing protein [Streptomyces sp. HUAS MG91]|uniref:GAF and ANTAR domain-containing protein n=1 Tax=Streptomyces tabacisoli TaxID=3156398 RepID=A0AAU8IR05_9ACTN